MILSQKLWSGHFPTRQPELMPSSSLLCGDDGLWDVEERLHQLVLSWYNRVTMCRLPSTLTQMPPVLSPHCTYCTNYTMATLELNTTVNFSDGLATLCQISNAADRDCQPWECQDSNHTFNVSKTKELMVPSAECSKHELLRIHGGHVERPCGPPTWSSWWGKPDSISLPQTPERLVAPPKGAWDTCTINNILTGNITTWIEPGTKHY